MTRRMASVAVLMPTVEHREAYRRRTVAQWRAFGVEPVVHVQDPTWPLSHASHTRHVNQAVAAVLADRPGASHILLCEDDVDLSPDLPEVLPDLLDDRVWSLWSAGLTFYPPAVRELLRSGRPLPGRMAVPAVSLGAWHGTIAVLMPAHAAAAVAGWDRTGLDGWDVLLRTWLRRQRRQLWLPVPNLAEHVGTISAVAPRGTSGFSRSASFGWPLEGAAV